MNIVFLTRFDSQNINNWSSTLYYMYNKLKQTDLLYINDYIAYLMNKSPLEIFSGYKDLYDSYEEVASSHVRIKVFGSEIAPEKDTKYQVIWRLRDSILYMADIRFNSISMTDYDLVFPDSDQYRLMEELTNVRFDEAISPLSNYPSLQINKIGLMPAKWSNDTVLIKRARKSWYEDFDKWIETPCEELIFKSGKLISMRITDIY